MDEAEQRAKRIVEKWATVPLDSVDGNIDLIAAIAAALREAHVRGLERAKNIAHESTDFSLKVRALEFARVSATIEDRIQAEIDKAGK